MGVYLAIVGLKDVFSRHKYLEVASQWVTSWECTILGSLSVVSAEVSLLILAFMSIERFLLISNPFNRKFNEKNILLCMYIIWLIGISIAVFPIIFYHSSTKFYGYHNGGTCFPFFVAESKALGWEISAIIFIGINSILLVVIAVLYTSLLFSIWKTRRATTLDFLDCEFAIRWV